jgi:hypothetical protein
MDFIRLKYMNIRLEGTPDQISKLTTRWLKNGIPTEDICKTFKIKSISKFYLNRIDGLTRPLEIGRVYVEVEDC